MDNIKSKVIPKSLFLSAILNLGRVVKSVSTLVNLNTFHLDTMVWSAVIFSNAELVVKKYETSVLKETEAINQSVEQHTRKMVQMHHLARNFAAQRTQVVLDQDLRDLLGETFSYKIIYLGKLPYGPEFVIVEECVEGKMSRFVNNDGTPYGNKGDMILPKAECLVHFSYEKSNYLVMLLDVQRVDYELFDPEVPLLSLLDSQIQISITQ